MAKTNISTTSRQVELIIRQLNSLSSLPEVATSFLTTAARANTLDKSAIASIIESDPALTAKTLSLAHEQSVSFASGKPSVREAVAKLPDELIRETILSLKIFHKPASTEGTLPIKDLALHCLTTACAAKEIANLTLDPIDRQIAVSAAMLHDIGKIAIAELMPRSFEKIAADAVEFNLSYHAAEQKNYGIDHTIIGKRLAEQWHLPKEIVMAIWLHHSDTEAISGNLTAGKIALVVTLADIIANLSGIGNSGSCDYQQITPEILQTLGITADQVENIRTKLPDLVKAKSNLLGLTNPGPEIAYAKILRQTAEKLAADYKELTTGNRDLQAANAHMKLICEFLGSVKPEMDTIEVSGIFAAAWKKYFQTGTVSIFTQQTIHQETLEVITVDDSGMPETQLVTLPYPPDAIPSKIRAKFALLNAYDTAKWIFDLTENDMSQASTVIIPLMVRQRAVGAVVFEHRCPCDPADQAENFATPAAIAAAVIGMTGICADHEKLSEQFADLLGQLKITREKLTESRSLAGVAEMAAGASHELNNPLAVISGRTQLLMDIETDENKQQMLKQIQARADEVSQIVADLMAFAKPSQPNQTTISVEDIIGLAVSQTAQQYNVTKLELNLESPADTPNVMVDPDQTAAAIRNILSNALDSYPGSSGPITISVDTPKEEGFVTVRITDTGCGMNTETLTKAFQPFFSAKPAGRKRGMGLSHARRLLDLNNAEIQIQSKPDQGTTVTIKFKL